MPLWKATLWEIRIWFGLRAIKHVATIHPIPWYLRPESAVEAWSAFLEHSDLSVAIIKSTEEERTLISEMFVSQWIALQRKSAH
jgi:hypothetical protein